MSQFILIFSLIFLYLSTRSETLPVSWKGVDTYVAGFVGLNRTLYQAAPGDRIILPKGVYPGPFIAAANGTEENPIELKAGDGMALILGNGKAPVLTISGNHWRVSGLDIANEGNTGMIVTGNDFTGSSLYIGKSATGVILNGEKNKLLNSTITASETGVVIADWAKDVQVSGNKIQKTKVCISYKRNQRFTC